MHYRHEMKLILHEGVISSSKTVGSNNEVDAWWLAARDEKSDNPG